MQLWAKKVPGWVPLLTQPLTEVLNESNDSLLILHEILGSLPFVPSVTLDDLLYSFPGFGKWIQHYFK